MATALVEAHIEAERRLRELTEALVGRIWDALPDYSDAGLAEFQRHVLPVVRAAQIESVAVTEAFVCDSIGIQPPGVEREGLICAAVRAGADPAEVYRRPFVTVWRKLKNGDPIPDAIRAGRSRAITTAVTDIQLSMRATLQAVMDA